MTPEQEAHLQRQKEHFLAEFDAKWRAGAASHGGPLHALSLLRLIKEAKQEVLDLWAFIDSIEEMVLGKNKE